MHLKLDTWLDIFIFFIILVKLVFIFSAIGHKLLSRTTSDKAKKVDPKLVYWKDRTEFIFTIAMAVLLIYYFNPRFSKKTISEESGLLFFLFGCILIFTAKWELFIHDTLWLK